MSIHLRLKEKAKAVKKVMNLKDELELIEKPTVFKREWLKASGMNIEIEEIEYYSEVNKELQELYRKDFLDNYYEQVK